MRVFKLKLFARFARRERIANASLIEAVERAERGLVDADLGSGLIKQRVARPGQGRSGGFRVLLAFQSRELSVFLYGFAKSERDNISDDELAVMREIAAAWLVASDDKLALAIESGLLVEVKDDQ